MLSLLFKLYNLADMTRDAVVTKSKKLWQAATEQVHFYRDK